MKSMKRVLLLIAVIFTTQFCVAQSQDLSRANAYFERTFYSEAIPLYENAIKNERTFEIIRNFADAYYYTNDLKNAEKWYRFLIKNFTNKIDEEYYFRFSHALKAIGNQEEANEILKSQMSLSENEITNFNRQIVILENIASLGNRFELKNLPINTENSDFGAAQFGNKLIYASPTQTSKKYKWNNENYLDLQAVSVLDFSKSEAIAQAFSNVINTKMHESNSVFTKDGRKMYFTRNNYNNGKKGKDKNKVSHLQIFSADFENGKWTNVKSLPFNSDEFSTEHPALSPDEKTLYFASDMPGSLGSFDIYSIEINAESFRKPINLGTTINTKHKEQFPFISEDGKLYYSSNGKLGFGSLDVFVSELKDGKFSEAVNVGFPVNSSYDDFAYTINPATNEGYFSSNRPGGKGGDDIYQIIEKKPLIVQDCQQFISGIVTDETTKLPLENAIVILQDESKNELKRITTLADGKFNFNANCENSFKVLASKEKYTEKFKSLKLNKERDKVNDASMTLKSLEEIKKEEAIALQETKKEEERAKIKAKELAEIKKKEEAKNTEFRKKEDAKIAEIKKKERIENLLAKEKDVVKDKDRLVIKTEPIYFDYDLWYIRKESKPILNKVIDLMKKYPDMVVEIGSHTDVRGNDKYNLNLSDKRAKSTREYFIENGIPKDRISSRGYGETVQIVKCVPEESCNEEQHELNRRSEFVIKNI